MQSGPRREGLRVLPRPTQQHPQEAPESGHCIQLVSLHHLLPPVHQQQSITVSQGPQLETGQRDYLYLNPTMAACVNLYDVQYIGRLHQGCMKHKLGSTQRKGAHLS